MTRTGSRAEVYPSIVAVASLNQRVLGVPVEIRPRPPATEGEQLQNAFEAIHPKRKVAQYLRAAPVLVEEVSEVSFR